MLSTRLSRALDRLGDEIEAMQQEARLAPLSRDPDTAASAAALYENICRRAATGWGHIAKARSKSYDYDALPHAARARKARDAVKKMLPKMVAHIQQVDMFGGTK